MCSGTEACDPDPSRARPSAEPVTPQGHCCPHVHSFLPPSLCLAVLTVSCGAITDGRACSRSGAHAPPPVHSSGLAEPPCHSGKRAPRDPRPHSEVASVRVASTTARHGASAQSRPPASCRASPGDCDRLCRHGCRFEAALQWDGPRPLSTASPRQDCRRTEGQVHTPWTERRSGLRGSPRGACAAAAAEERAERPRGSVGGSPGSWGGRPAQGRG